MHISRTERPAGVPPYKPASAVILAELGKLLCSLLLAYRECKKALKKERNPSSTFLFDADTEQSANVLSRSSSLNSLHRQSQSQSRKGSLATYPQLDAIAEIEEKNKGLLPSADIKPTSLPMSRRTSSQSSSISVNTSSSTSSTPQGKYSSLPKHRRESSLTEEDDELLPEYPGSPSERIRNDFANEEITPMEVIKRMKQDTFGPDWLKLSIPAFLFTGQSNLSYYASSNLSVPVFQITYQLKIPATALCSVLMLNRSLSRTQWFSIALLSIGVGIVQLASSTADQAYHSHSDDIPEKSELLYGPGNNSTGNAILDSRAIHEIGKGHVEMNQMLGLMAVILACLSSGFSSVFFEKQLKRAPAPLPSSASAGADSSNSNRDPSESNHSQQTTTRKTGLWIRNIQLSMFSLLVGSTIYAITSPNDIPDFLIGFAPIVWFVVFVQIVGGLLAALVIQYADNIAKSFSTSCSIILSFAVSIAFFDFRLSLGVIIGSTAVMLATWLFNTSGSKSSIAIKNNTSVLPTSSPSNSPQSRRADYTRLPNTSPSENFQSISKQSKNQSVPHATRAQ